MFQPGRETNIPTSSNANGLPSVPAWAGQKLFAFDGITVTLGLVILAVALIWLWATFIKR